MPTPENREKLIQAAIVEFAAHGRDGARVAEIADRAGLTQRVVSQLFGGKEGLYDEAVIRAASIADRSGGAGTGGLALTDVAVKAVLDAVANPQIHRLLIRAALEHDASTPPETPEDEVRAVAAAEADAELDPGFVALAIRALAAVPAALPGDVARLTGHDPADPDFGWWYAGEVRKLVRRLR